MKQIVHLMILIALLLLSACAISDLSMMQTAVPTGGGAVKASAYMGNGMNLYPTQDFREIYNAIAASDTVDYFLEFVTPKDWLHWGKEREATVSGLCVNIGITDDTDIIAKAFVSGSFGYTLGVKHLIHQSQGKYFAIMPVFSVSKSSNMTSNSSEGQTVFYADDKNVVSSLEIHGIWSETMSPKVLITFSPHLSFTRLNRTYNSKEYGPYYIPHAGLRGNLRYTWKRIFFTGELGLEMVGKHSSGLMMVPSYACEMGLNLGKK